jgi:uncharacterized hydrophobic protein (TIGR00271 family)
VNNFFDKFRLHSEKENLETVISNIDAAVVFRGTNLWILIFAILVASLGLNINSNAVIIGAMLISPIMGPIMGIGLGIGISDLKLLKKAFYNYLVASGVALATSTLYFLLSPLNEAHSEILARTSPTIYDVLIAFFGGFAGMIATSSKQKGNVIPGVAIATALMPPLCTAGYGLATLNPEFFFGAFYLFIINTVFIALATFILARVLHLPHTQLQNEKSERLAKRIVWVVSVITFLPSVYFGYDMVQRDRFLKEANRFISNEAHFTNDYLLNRKIDAKTRNISLVFGGNVISAKEIMQLKQKLKNYRLPGTTLDVKQGFAYIAEDNEKGQNELERNFAQAIEEREQQIAVLQKKIDSIQNNTRRSQQIFAEIKAQYPALLEAVIQPIVEINVNAKETRTILILLSFSKKLSQQDKIKIENWLKIRLQEDKIKLIFQQ